MYAIKNLGAAVKSTILSALFLYKKGISPFLKHFLGNGCRYTPSCSEYAYQAIEKYGTIKGGKLALLRIMRCHPFAKFGYDPLPDTA